MSTPKRYRKKPVVIEAMRWDGSADSASSIIDWALEHGVTINYWCWDGEECRKGLAEHKLAIPTLEGRMSAITGDFIIKGVQGEFYPCKPDIFAATYEEA